MRLDVRVIGRTDDTADSPTLLDRVHAVIAQRASAWTPPVHVSTDTLDNGVQQFTYTTDAVPKASGIVTTANVAPTLLPPTIT